MSVAGIVLSIVRFYVWLIIAYVLMSWFPMRGVLAEIQQVLASVVEPYLGLFRRIVPPLGAVDISPIIAILVLQLVTNYVLVPVLATLT
jgi:YggT family protein